MKKIKSFLPALLAFSFSFSQTTQIATPLQTAQYHTFEAKERQLMIGATHESASAHKWVDPLISPSTQLVSSLHTVSLGRASNAYSILTQEQNQVYANDAQQLIAFIHRHNIVQHGGGAAGNGRLRYDLSIDGGWSFSVDNGVLNSAYTRPARYPNISGIPGSGSDPLASSLLFLAPTLDQTPAFEGLVSGVSNVSNGGEAIPSTGTEHYDYLDIGAKTLTIGGLVRGNDSTFWAADNEFDKTSGAILDSLYIFKGISSMGDISWSRIAIKIPYEASIIPSGGSAGKRFVGPNVGVSPDGQNIWVGWLGDLVGGHDSVYSPCFVRSTDGGMTWGNPTEVDLRLVPDVADSLMGAWANIDTISPGVFDTTILGTGNPTTAFDYDMTVDANGNPHFFTILGNSPVPDTALSYSFQSGIEKHAVDITTTDGGTTWLVNWVAPVLTFRGEFGQPDVVTLDNSCQISRSEDGNTLFYSWTDSDTAIIGWGISDNPNPNLRISAYRITDGYRTPWKKISDGDLVWDGKMLAPTMAPTVLSYSDAYRLPIVFLQLLNNNATEQCLFHYVGGSAYFLKSEFVPVTSVDYHTGVLWVGNQPKGGISNEVVLHACYPNPTSDMATITFDLQKSMEVEVSLFNLQGQKISTMYSGNAEAGTSGVEVDASKLTTGMYIYTLKAGNQTLTGKMVVSH